MRSVLQSCSFLLSLLALLIVFPKMMRAGQDTSQLLEGGLSRNQADVPSESKYKSDRVIVRFRPGVTRQAMLAVHARVGGKVLNEPSILKRLHIVQLSNSLSVRTAISRYRADPTVQYAEPDYVVHTFDIPNDPQFPTQWNLQNTGQDRGKPGADIHAVQAWGLSTGSPGVVVAVIDTGIDYTHPDLTANVWTAPSSFSATGQNGLTVDCAAGSRGLNVSDWSGPTCDPMDDNNHGTHVSGIIGAVGNNGTGVAGINWTVQILPCKAFDLNGTGFNSEVIYCLDFIKQMKDSGVNIIATNNSYGGGLFSQALQDAISEQMQDGILFIAAAGNNFSDNDDFPVYPANISTPNVLAVAATTRTDDLVAFSNAGRHTVHLAAPGVEILSTTPNNTYSIYSGTSMAAPHVTGVAALLKAQDPSRDWRAIKNLILAGGDTLSTVAETITQKRLNAYGAMTCSNSLVQSRLSPVPATISGSVGTPILLSAININCAQPAGNVTVQITPGGQTVTLRDDGTGADQAAGDGIYTAQWTPSSEGSYALQFPDGSVEHVEVLGAYGVTQTTYSYQTIAGTNLNLGDDSVALVAAPFPIQFGGGSFSQFYVSSNGTISFTDPFGDYFYQDLTPGGYPSYDIQPTTLVAPFWQDLFPVKGTDQNVFWQVTGSAPNRQLVVEWRNVRSFECRTDANATVTFEVVFQESTDDIRFNYLNTEFGGDCNSQDFGIDAAIGVQTSPAQTTVWSFEYGRTAGSTTLLWQSPPTSLPSTPLPTLASISPTSGVAQGPDISLTVTGTGFVSSSAVRWDAAPLPTTYISSTQLSAVIPSFYMSPMGRFYQLGSAVIDVYNPPPGGGASNSIKFPYNYVSPTISSLSPASVAAGSPAFYLTVTGERLLGATLTWNGVQILSGGIDNTHVVANIPASLIAAPGTVQIAAVYFGTGVPPSNQLTFKIVPATQSAQYPGLPPVSTQRFDPKTAPPREGPVRFMGWNWNNGANREAYLRKFTRGGSRTAQPNRRWELPQGPVAAGSPSLTVPQSLPGYAFRPSLPAGYLPTAVATGDFNRDGKMDWVVANGGSNDLWIYFGKGDGTAQLPVIIPLKGQSPLSVATADLRKTGVLDLVVAEADSGTVGVLLGNGDGTFGAEVEYYVPGSPCSVAVADVDGDGTMDIVAGIAGGNSTGPFAVLLGDGLGNFGKPITSPFTSRFPTGFATTRVIPVDLNGDGLPDLVVADQGSPYGGIFSYVNEGGGVFKQAQDVVENQPNFFFDVAVGDLDGDGCPDLAVAEIEAGAVWTFAGNCDGSFESTGKIQRIGSGENIASIVLGDLNGDGHLDIVAAGAYNGEYRPYGQMAGNLVSVLLGDGHGNFSSARVYRGDLSMYGLALADLNGDGRPDAITANQDTDTASVYLNNGNGEFDGPAGAYIGYPPPEVFNAPASNFFVQDVNGDGKPDLCLFEQPEEANPYYWMFTTLINQGNGKFSNPVRSPAVLYYQGILMDAVLADFRNTGSPDLLTLANSYGQLGLYLSFNDGGQFAPSTLTPLPGGSAGVFAVGDFDGDGKLDVVVAITPNGSDSQVLTFCHGNGDGTFTPGATMQLTSSDKQFLGAYKIIAADVNRDGRLDLVILAGAVFELVGNGDGTFAAPKLVIANGSDFSAADLNHDGLVDLVTYNLVPSQPSAPGSLTFSIYLGKPDGSFPLFQTYTVPVQGNEIVGPSSNPSYPFHVDIPGLADLNGDGNPDIELFAGDFAAPEVRPTFVVLAGNGDGTFSPFYGLPAMPKASVPQTIADVNGDGRADLVELDGFPASYHVIPAVPGSPLWLTLAAQPTVGSSGMLTVHLSLLSSTATAIQLSVSDPKIQIAPSVTIPAGSLSVDVPFNIMAGFDSSRVFALTAILGTQSATIYSHQTTSDLVAFRIFPQFLLTTVIPSGTVSGAILALSVGGYRTTLQFSCLGLPPGATCSFNPNPFDLWEGQSTLLGLSIRTTANTPIGIYPVTIVATNGELTTQTSINLNVADFTLTASPASVSVIVGGTTTYNGTVNPVGAWDQLVGLNCQFTPSVGAPSCTTMIPYWSFVTGTSVGTIVAYYGATPGDYSLTVTGLALGTTHTAVPITVHVGNVNGSVSPSAATIAVGSSANFSVTLNSINGWTDQFTFSCPGLPAGITCTFNPATGTLPEHGTLASTLTIGIDSKTAVVLSNRASMRSVYLAPFAQAITICLLLFVLLAVHHRPGKSSVFSPDGIALALLLTFFIIHLMACGGGSGGGGSSGSPPPTVTLQANPTNIIAGSSSTLSWTSSNATQITISPGVGSVPAQGNRLVTPTESTNYNITAIGPGGSASTNASITVNHVLTFTVQASSPSITFSPGYVTIAMQ